MTDHETKRGRKLRGIYLVLPLLLLLVVAGLVFYFKFEGQAPSLSLTPEPAILGKQATVTLRSEDRGAGLREIQVDIIQGEKTASLFSGTYPSGTHKIEEVVKLAPPSGELHDGEAVLRTVVRDRSWRKGGNPTVTETKVTIDISPPTLEVLSRFGNVNLGGSGLVVYRASETLINSGVEVGDLRFPGFQQQNGAYVAFFAFPHDASPTTPIVLRAEDRAGNPVNSILYYRINTRSFREDNLPVTEEFLESVVPYFMERDPSLKGDLLGAFLRVNRELRKATHQKIRRLCQETASQPIWSGPFVRMAKARTTSGFADHRIFIYKEREIDRQFHLGVDLASLVNSPVKAANHGRVIFAGELGIYGNTVFLDHGCGLSSMYSHLSRVDVQAGQIVEKGQLLGLTGATGLATGDHLHFSILVSGVFVNPVEWWDPKWIKDQVEGNLALMNTLK